MPRKRHVPEHIKNAVAGDSRRWFRSGYHHDRLRHDFAVSEDRCALCRTSLDEEPSGAGGRLCAACVRDVEGGPFAVPFPSPFDPEELFDDPEELAAGDWPEEVR